VRVVKTYPLHGAIFAAIIGSRYVFAKHETLERRQSASLLVAGGEPARAWRAGGSAYGALFGRFAKLGGGRGTGWEG